MIPPVEEDNLLLTFAEAMELAEAGEKEEGHDLLAGGLCRAEDFSREGEEWAEALVDRYRDALERFDEMFR